MMPELDRALLVGDNEDAFSDEGIENLRVRGHDAQSRPPRSALRHHIGLNPPRRQTSAAVPRRSSLRSR